MSRADGGWKTLCIKIGYSKPKGAESREPRTESRDGFSTLAESSRVFLGDELLDSNWLRKFKGFFVLDSD